MQVISEAEEMGLGSAILFWRMCIFLIFVTSIRWIAPTRSKAQRFLHARPSHAAFRRF